MSRGSNPAREQRIGKVWRRFCKDMRREGLSTPEQLATYRSGWARANCVRYWQRQGLPQRFRFATALEAADLGLEATALRRPLPAAARPGSRDKVETLRRRYERGLHLHDEADFRVDDDGRDPEEQAKLATTI